jgi:hypothetical protein
LTHRRPEHFHIRQLKRTYNHETDTFTINLSYETAPTILTERTKEVAEAFGLGPIKHDNLRYMIMSISAFAQPMSS